MHLNADNTDNSASIMNLFEPTLLFQVDRKELKAKMAESGNIGKVMEASDHNSDLEITKDEWNKMFDIMNAKFGVPDQAAIDYAKAVVEELGKTKASSS